MRRNKVKCTVCGDVIERKDQERTRVNPGKNVFHCEFCQRKLWARTFSLEPHTNGEIWAAIEIHEAEMDRMYAHNLGRFGKTAKITAWFTGAVLAATGILQVVASALTSKEGVNAREWLMVVFYIVVGVFVGGLVNLWWWLRESEAE